MPERKIQTSHGKIAVHESHGADTPILFIHGNSLCKEVFQRQLDAEIGARFHCIAIDLPGHGSSENALDPARSYTFGGYADAVLEVMKALDIHHYAILGWSLGGHIAIEMMGRSQDVKGLCLTGTPALSKNPDDLLSAILPNPAMEFLGKKELSQQQTAICFETIFEAAQDNNAFLQKSFHRADGLAREILFSTVMSGDCMDHKKLLETTSTPLAIINSEEEPLVSNDFIKSQNYSSLWEEKVHLLPSKSHAPFWGKSEMFNALLQRFVSQLE